MLYFILILVRYGSVFKHSENGAGKWSVGGATPWFRVGNDDRHCYISMLYLYVMHVPGVRPCMYLYCTYKPTFRSSAATSATVANKITLAVLISLVELKHRQCRPVTESESYH